MKDTVGNRWFICWRRAVAPRLRLFAFPYAGGGASVFRSWVPLLPDGIELFGFQPPGRDGRFSEPVSTSLDEVVSAGERVIRELARDGVPFAFFGHSLGALVAYSITCCMETASGVTPRHLIVSACVAPHRQTTVPDVHDLPDNDFIDWVQGLGGTPPEVWANAEMRELLLPILRADFRLVASFRDDDREPLHTPITALGGESDHSVPHDALAAWQERTRSASAVYMLPGDHFFVHSTQGTVVERVLHVLGEPPSAGARPER